MASSPRFKVYTREGEYVAACKHAEHAAAIVGLEGEGATVRLDHKHIIWREGAEDGCALESYDYAAEIMHSRIPFVARAPR